MLSSLDKKFIKAHTIGASAISVGKYASHNDVKTVEELLRASGKTIVADESLQDAVTATSGSGPDYFFRFVVAMIEGTKELGLSESDAKTLVIQTITSAYGVILPILIFVIYKGNCHCNIKAVPNFGKDSPNPLWSTLFPVWKS